MTVPPSPFDRDMMRIALGLARRGLGTTAPNPAVGAVIADETTGEVIARGWTQPGGRPHAETEAIRRAGDRARGRTMYVTLEPCAHFGQTPPCTEAILAAGLSRVVVGARDPDPRTAGEGLARLRAAGRAVSAGVLEDEARWVTLGHILRVTEGRPFVTVKIATDAAGGIAPGDGTAPRWVTGPEARAAGHRLRADADAILIGAGTLRADDPDLTCRLPGLAGRSPLRVVLAGATSLEPGARLLATARHVPVLVLRAGPAREEDRQLQDAGVEIVAAGVAPDPPDLRAALAVLAGRGITRLLVEGGPRTWRRFADAGVVDEVVLFMAGGSGAGGAGTDPPDPDDRARRVLCDRLGRLQLDRTERRPVGTDTMWRLRRAGA